MEAQGNGTFIVIEGTDGSGKGTQFELLKSKLITEGYDVATFDFPQYDQQSSYFVREYLNGKYGSADQVGPYTASLFYALDRYQAAPAIRQALQQGKVVIANRFTGSNMAHQGTKFTNTEERRGYFLWLDSLEFMMLGIPRPNKSFVLRVPPDVAQGLVDKKPARSYTTSKRDIHEADLGHLTRSVEVYDSLCHLFPQDFARIDCVRSGKLLTKEQIQNLLWEAVLPYLPEKPTMSSGEAEAAANDVKPAAEPNVIEKYVTDVDSNVYAFTNEVGQSTVAALLAGICRYGGDARESLARQLSGKEKLDEPQIQKLLKTYDDDSIGQMFSRHFVVENASLLMARKLKRGRLGAYVEQPSHLHRYDQKNNEGSYKYYTPPYLDDATKKLYVATMNQIFTTYSTLLAKTIQYVRENSESSGTEQSNLILQAFEAVRPLLPLASTTSVGLFLSAQSQDALVANLLGDDLPEAWETGQKLIRHIRQADPVFFEGSNKSDKVSSAISHKASSKRSIRRLSGLHLPTNHTPTDPEMVVLAGKWPNNELDTVADILYEHSDQSLSSIRKHVSQLNYEAKLEILESYIGKGKGHKPGRALENVHYTWDIICDFDSFQTMQRNRMVDDMEWQNISPRFGYDIPKHIEDAGLSDSYSDCFDLSLRLHSVLQAAGYEYEAQYAALLGHRMRFKVTINAREMFHIIQTSGKLAGKNGYQKLCQQMLSKIAESHPLLANYMDDQTGV